MTDNVSSKKINKLKKKECISKYVLCMELK